MLDLPPQDAIVAVILVGPGGGPTQGAENLADLVLNIFPERFVNWYHLCWMIFTKYT